MTSGQRKAHKYIWLLMIIIIPSVIFFSIKDLNIFPLENNTSPHYNGSKKVSLKMTENEIIKASVFKSHVEIILKSTLKSSSSIVYGVDQKGNKSTVIGQLTTAGIYNFNINTLPKGIIIYDDLKQVEITKIYF